MNDDVLYKLFGVVLDASDDPFSLQLKNAAIDAQEYGVKVMTADPHDVLLPELTVGFFGRISVPSWLGGLSTPDRRTFPGEVTANRTAHSNVDITKINMTIAVGSYFADHGKAMAKERLDEFYSTEAELLITACPHCREQFRKYVSNGEKNRIMDLVEFVDGRV
jgi:hypothetical protein